MFGQVLGLVDDSGNNSNESELKPNEILQSPRNKKISKNIFADGYFCFPGNKAYEPWTMDHGPWSMDHGPWSMEHG